MTVLHHPFPLDCFSEIQACVSEYMKDFEVENIYIKNIPVPDRLVAKLNSELTSYGLGKAWNFLCFKRKNFLIENLNVHIDYSSESGLVHSSIVIPVEGCDNTSMYWATGEYDVEVFHLNDGAGTYARPKWKSMPSISERVTIHNTPTLVKVDVPHNVTSRLDGSYRTILSVRIEGNPTFEEVINKRYNISL